MRLYPTPRQILVTCLVTRITPKIIMTKQFKLFNTIRMNFAKISNLDK